VGLLGRNGAGKTTLLRLLLGRDTPVHTGSVRRGATVVPELLDQRIVLPDPQDRVLPWLERSAARVVVTTGEELTASQLLEEFGFAGDAAWRRLGDLSGGELRRLHLLRLLLAGPNLLLLDEPTNDLDVETLTVLEDLLDRWPGTLLVVSHDRYFLERVCDDFWVLPGDGTLQHLPGGIEAYLRSAGTPAPSQSSPSPLAAPSAERQSAAARDRERRRDLARLERAMDRAQRQVDLLHDQMAKAATDPAELVDLGRRLQDAEASLADAEEEWLLLAAE
jgi:ATP-binding cassette subfamily F protein uup